MKASSVWKIESEFVFTLKNAEKLLDVLLENRGITTKKEKETFLHPDISTVTSQAVGIEQKDVTKTLKRIEEAVAKKQKIIIFGDYDVDGICGTAILWETLYSLGANVSPYIPHRVGEGYGLSIAGVENVVKEFPDTKLIITVDNGIVAQAAVDFANGKKIDVIITDHHTIGKELPKAHAIFHTTQLCGTAVAWMLSREILSSSSEQSESRSSDGSLQLRTNKNVSDHLALVALATVADLVPLTNSNRALLVEGLKILHTTKRPGIVALCADAQIDQEKIGVYEIGHMIGPRLNAMGRIASAMDSLRLLCTKDPLKAKVLADKLGVTNRERQNLTKSLSEHAILQAVSKNGNLLFIAHETYDEGVIGLVAGKLVEEYYRPSIVLSIGEKISKASARSISGFNIIEFIRKAEHLLINAGGHPMAAGFTVATENISALEKFLLAEVDGQLTGGQLVKNLRIDCALSIDFVSQELFDDLQQLSPFGMGNPEPTFVSKAKVIACKTVGKDKNHLSLFLESQNKNKFNAIAFGMGEWVSDIQIGSDIQIAYVIDENEWKGKKSLQLKIKGIQIKS